MLCHNCGADNPPGRRFCEECGERLASIEHQREKDRSRARRAAARSRLEGEADLTPAERRRRELRTRKQGVKLNRGRLLIYAGLLLTAVILVIVLVMTLSGSSGPEKAVNRFLDSLQKKDLVNYLKYTDRAAYTAVTKQGQTVDLATYVTYDEYRISGIKLQTVSSSPEAAEVRIVGGIMEARLSSFAPQTLDFSISPRTVQLINEDGNWVITNYQEVQLPYEIPELLTPEQSDIEQGL